MTSVRKSDSTDIKALILEIAFGFCSILGMGWLYAGNIAVGVPALIGFFVLNVIEFVGLIVVAGRVSGSAFGLGACVVFLINMVIVVASGIGARSYVRDTGVRGRGMNVVMGLMVPVLLFCSAGVAMTMMGPQIQSTFSEILYQLGAPVP